MELDKVKKLSIQERCTYLEKEGLDKDTIQPLKANKISGTAFIALTERNVPCGW